MTWYAVFWWVSVVVVVVGLCLYALSGRHDWTVGTIHDYRRSSWGHAILRAGNGGYFVFALDISVNDGILAVCAAGEALYRVTHVRHCNPRDMWHVRLAYVADWNAETRNAHNRMDTQ